LENRLIVSGGSVLVGGSFAEALSALDGVTGQVKWQTRPRGDEPRTYDSPNDDGNYVDAETVWLGRGGWRSARMARRGSGQDKHGGLTLPRTAPCARTDNTNRIDSNIIQTPC
jgi:hypothetical protein